MNLRPSSAENHKTLVSRIATDIWNAGDLAVCDEVMAAYAKYHGPHVQAGDGGT